MKYKEMDWKAWLGLIVIVMIISVLVFSVASVTM